MIKALGWLIIEICVVIILGCIIKLWDIWRVGEK